MWRFPFLVLPVAPFSRPRNDLGLFVIVGIFCCLGSLSSSASLTTLGNLAIARKDHSVTVLSLGEVLVAGGTGSSVLASTEIYEPRTGRVTPGPDMITARSQHTGLLLSSGLVLVAGGKGGSGVELASAELYDSVTKTWTQASGLNIPRYGHTATLLNNGKVLFAGGFGGGALPLQSAEIYDPATGLWSLTGSLAVPRGGHTATLLADGRVVVTGGLGSDTQALASGEIFDPATNLWSPLAAMQGPRYHHATVLLADGRLVAIGGQANHALGTVEVYQPSSNTWSPGVPLQTARAKFSSNRLPNGQVIVLGGTGADGPVRSVEVFNPDAGSWTVAASLLQVARHSHVTALLPNGKLIIFGGQANPNTTAVIERFDAATPSWLPTGSLAAGRYLASSHILPSGKLLVSGGFQAGDALNSSHVYDPSTNAWSPPAAMAVKRFAHTSALLHDGRLLVVAGLGSANAVLASSEIYQEANGLWTPSATLAVGTYYHVMLTLPNGKVLLAGGTGASGIQSRAVLYDPAQELWLPTAAMHVARSNATATLLTDGKVLVVGGIGVTGEAIASAEIYDPESETWTVTADLTSPRQFHTASLLGDGRVLITGGADTESNPQAGAEIYDPVQQVWVAAAAPLLSRYSHAAAVLPDGRVLVFGGLEANFLSTSEAELYDPLLNVWSPAPAMQSDRYFMSVATLPQGQVMAIGGVGGLGVLDSVERFDPGLGFMNSARPVVTSAYFTSADQLVVTGSGFTQGPEGSGGGTASSASNQPRVMLTHLVNGQSVFVTADSAAPFSNSLFTSTQVRRFPVGLAFLTLYSKGIPSVSRVIFVPEPAVPKLAVRSVSGLALALGASVDFGLVPIGEQAVLSFIIQNGGRADLTGLTISFEGANAGLFSLTTTPVSPVTGPGGGTSFSVRYAPLSSGAKTAVMKLTSNDPELPVFSLNLRGTNLSSNANLAGLTLSYGSFSPALAPDVLTYSAEVPNGISTLSMTPLAAQAGASITINQVLFSSGQASQPIALIEGLNTIRITVLAEDGVTSKTYILNVARTGPVEMVVQEPEGTGLPDGGSRIFAPLLTGTSALKTFSIRNLGTNNLTGLVISKEGSDTTDFELVTLPVAPLAGGGATSFSVRFRPTTGGLKTATLRISSNDVVRNPFDIDLSGWSLSRDQDTDGDGLSNAAELQMAALGFNWQVAQNALVNTYFATAEEAGLYTEAQIAALHVDTPLLKRNRETGQVTLTLGLRRSTDLVQFVPMPFTAPQLTVNAQGQLEFRFTPSGSVMFFKLEGQ